MIDTIFNLFNTRGHLSYGEDITQIEHALQCGQLAREDGAHDALIGAALLHDIGQLLDDAGNAAQQRGVDARHEITGAAFLARAFPDAVTEPIRMHVDAKRYLCAAGDGYRQSLSDASELSLRLQGGPMDESEAQAFRQASFYADAVCLRRYDDTGKRRNWEVPSLESYRSLLEGLTYQYIGIKSSRKDG